MIIKIVTISLMAVFYICYFAKLISQKKQGIKTDQLGKGKEGFVKFIEVALKIITYLLPVIQIISIVFYSGTAHIVLQFTGVVITMFGVLAFIVSVTQMKENWRAGVQKEEKTNLVTTGIYSISRNPAFLGFDCNGVQREHNKKLNNGLPILHKVPPKRDYGRYFCIMAEKGGTSHGA